MDFKDLVTLAKAGYGPKQVKELLEMCETSPKVKETTPETITSMANNQNNTSTLGSDTPTELDAFAKLVADSKDL